MVAILVVVALSVGLSAVGFTKTVPVTVISDRAGLVMNPDARVKMRGRSARSPRSSRAPTEPPPCTSRWTPTSSAHPRERVRRHRIDHGVRRQVRRTPAASDPQRSRMYPARWSTPATVEINTVFQQLVSVLPSSIRQAQPDARRHRQGVQRPRGRSARPWSPTSTALLAKPDPSLPNLKHDIEVG